MIAEELCQLADLRGGEEPKANALGAPSAGRTLAGLDLHGADPEPFGLGAACGLRRACADVGLVYLSAAQRIAMGVDGCGAQLGEPLEGRLIVRRACLVLDLPRGDARRESGDPKGA